MIKNYLILIRWHHWVKNLLIFFPLLLSFNEYSNLSIINSIYVFIAFCFVASGIYIFNDIKDINLDKNNTRTKNRPAKTKGKVIASQLLRTKLIAIPSFSLEYGI